MEALWEDKRKLSEIRRRFIYLNLLNNNKANMCSNNNNKNKQIKPESNCWENHPLLQRQMVVKSTCKKK